MIPNFACQASPESGLGLVVPQEQSVVQVPQPRGAQLGKGGQSIVGELGRTIRAGRRPLHMPANGDEWRCPRENHGMRPRPRPPPTSQPRTPPHALQPRLTSQPRCHRGPALAAGTAGGPREVLVRLPCAPGDDVRSRGHCAPTGPASSTRRAPENVRREPYGNSDQRGDGLPVRGGTTKALSPCVYSVSHDAEIAH